MLIGQASGRFARAGLVPLLSFMAFLSINLAILNLLPIPVLDGGHLVFLLRFEMNDIREHDWIVRDPDGVQLFRVVGQTRRVR